MNQLTLMDLEPDGDVSLAELIDVARRRGVGYAISWAGDRRSSDRVESVALFGLQGIGPRPMPPGEAAAKLRTALGSL